MKAAARRRWALVPALLPLLVLLVGAVHAFTGLSQASTWVAHTSEVELTVADLLQSLVDAETSQRGYLASGDPEFLDTYEARRSACQQAFERVAELTADNARQQERLVRLRSLVAGKLSELEATRAAYDRGERGDALAGRMLAGKHEMDDIRGVVAQMQHEEKFLAAARQRDREVHARWTLLLCLGSITGFGIVLAIVWTQRRAAEKAAALAGRLDAAKADLQALFDNVPVGLSFVDPELRYRRINAMLAERINGLPVEAHLGKRVSEVLPGLPRELEGKLRHVLETGETVAELVYGETPAKPGVRIWRATYFPVRAPDRRIVGVGNAIEEVTTQHEAHERYRALVQAVGDIVWTNSAAGEMRGPQPAWCAYTGQSEEEAQGYGWAKVVHPEDAQPTIDEWKRAVTTRTPFVFEHRLRRHDGLYRWFAIRAVPVLQPDGTVHEWVGLHRDIDEEKSAAAALERERSLLRAAQRAATIGIFDWDGRSDEAFWSPEMYALLGEKPGGIVPNAENWQARTHPDDRERCWRAGVDATAARVASFQVDHRMLQPDGSSRWVQSTYQMTYDDAGHVVRCLGAAVDIQELRELTERERAARLEAEQASRAKDEFLAMLGHELRNPLAPIATAVHLLKLRSKSGLSREIDVIERQSKHIGRLVDDLLDVSRVARGKVVLNKGIIETADLVASAIETASPVIENAHHQLVLRVPKHGMTVDVDRGRMTQVLANLLTNAAKYTPPGGRITMTARREADDVVIAVEDTGTGIAPDLLPRVFDVFVQARQTLDRSQGGLGLGLTLVKNLVAMHQGSVSAESEGLGRGSTFTVRLPAARESAAPFEPPAPPATADDAPMHRVLVVDDNADGAALVSEALEMLGYRTAVAHDGPDALRVAEEFAPQVALLDIGLPVMDGYELAARLREQWPELELVAITGYGQDSDRQRTRSAGFRTHLTKPVDLDQLAALLARLVGGEEAAAPPPH